MISDTLFPRRIRSFVLRQGRLSPLQRHALEELSAPYLLPHGKRPLDLAACFGRQAPRVLEIGFGMGDSLCQMAQSQPEYDFIGAEVHSPGVGALIDKLHTHEVPNVRIAQIDVQDLLARLPANSLTRVQVFFPDPWPKKRHHKRRLIQSDFVGCLASKLVSGGVLHFATDWDDYAEHMQQVMQCAEGFASVLPPARPETKFERRGRRLGHRIVDLAYQKS